MKQMGIAEQRLRRDTPTQGACPAEPCIAFDHGNLKTELRGANRGNVAAGTRTDDSDVELRRTHVLPFV